MSVYFTVNGTRYLQVPTDEWTFQEAREFQRVAGMSVGKGILALNEMDMDAHLAWLVLSMRRADPTITADVLDAVKIEDVFGSMEDIEEPADPAPNPPTASPSDSGGNGGAISASPRTPAPSGTQRG